MREESAPGRPREFDETETLRRIMTLFWRGGYEGVSLASIMAATGLRKGSLYAAYGDKRAMYLKALAQYEVDVVEGAARRLKDLTVPAPERLEAFLGAPLHALRQGDRSGCFLCNASSDQADLHEEVKSQVGGGFDRLTRGLVRALTDFHPTLSSEGSQAKARALLTVYIGLRVLVRSGAELDALAPAASVALELASD